MPEIIFTEDERRLIQRTIERFDPARELPQLLRSESNIEHLRKQMEKDLELALTCGAIASGSWKDVFQFANHFADLEPPQEVQGLSGEESDLFWNAVVRLRWKAAEWMMAEALVPASI